MQLTSANSRLQKTGEDASKRFATSWRHAASRLMTMFCHRLIMGELAGLSSFGRTTANHPNGCYKSAAVLNRSASKRSSH
mmetsp:Transcript_6857/g.7785  ORF Transcript_6857/g.7785 Transcript_6857/m.7785 type:complete len:80 (+) Transcript_6857:178-417(+)